MTPQDINKLVSEAREKRAASPGERDSKAWEEDRFYSKDEVSACEYEAYACNTLPELCDAIELLMKQLEKCKEQRNLEVKYNSLNECESREEAEAEYVLMVESYDKELEQIEGE